MDTISPASIEQLSIMVDDDLDQSLNDLKAKANYVRQWDALPSSRRSSFSEAADDLSLEALKLIGLVDAQRRKTHPITGIFRLLSDFLIRACEPDASADKVGMIPAVARLIYDITRECAMSD